MANPPRRRPSDPMAAAEAVFAKKAAPAPAAVSTAPPGARELVSLRIDAAVLEYFQEDGPGWQDRINDALRHAVATMKGQ